MHLEIILLTVLIAVPLLLAIIFIIFHIGIGLAQELQELPRQLKEFSVRGAKCLEPL